MTKLQFYIPVFSVCFLACSDGKEDLSEEEIKRNYFTENYFGSATVVPGESFEGTHYYQSAQNSQVGVGVALVELIWNASGTPEANPAICVDCAFAFDVEFQFDAEASTDLEGQGLDQRFSYALGASEYGENTLFYGYNGSWGIWLVDQRKQIDDQGTEHAETVLFSGSTFSYDDGRVDFYRLEE